VELLTEGGESSVAVDYSDFRVAKVECLARGVVADDKLCIVVRLTEETFDSFLQ